MVKLLLVAKRKQFEPKSQHCDKEKLLGEISPGDQKIFVGKISA